VEWWLVESKRNEEHDDGEGDSDSASDEGADEEGSSDNEMDSPGAEEERPQGFPQPPRLKRQA
jgi:hypothetical protein